MKKVDNPKFRCYYGSTLKYENGYYNVVSERAHGFNRLKIHRKARVEKEK